MQAQDLVGVSRRGTVAGQMLSINKIFGKNFHRETVNA